MRWCYQIGRSFRYNLVSGQLINHLSHPVFFTKSPQRSTWQSWPQLLTSHSCWHSSYSWRFCKNHAGQKSVPIWCWNFPWSKKHRKNPGDFHLRAPLGFCQYTLRSSISGSSVRSQPWSTNLMIFTKLETGQTETEMTNRAVSDWIYWLQACTIAPFFYRVISLVNDHTGSIVLQIALLDAGWIIYQCPEDHRWSKKTTSNLGKWFLNTTWQKNPKASQRTAFWNTKKLVGKDVGISFAMKYIQQLYHNPWRISPVRRTWHMTKRSTQTRVRALLLTYWRVAIQCLMIHIYMKKTTWWEIASKIYGPFPGKKNIPYPTYGKTKKSHLSNHLERVHVTHSG